MNKRKINTVHLIVIFNLFTIFTLFAQVKTNLEVVESLVDTSAKNIVKNIKETNNKELNLKFIASNDYSILQTELISELQKNDFEILNNKKEQQTLNYTLNNAGVKYKNIFKDGILGAYLVERESAINGSFFIEHNGRVGKVIKFNYTQSDTVLYDDIKSLDNIAYQFTSAELPSEPFFSSLLEPTIAIGTAAIAVYLFFNIRSK